MSYTREEILNKVLEIIENVKHNSIGLEGKNYDKSLIGVTFKMTYQHLIFIFLEVMEEFKIKFEKEDVINYKFNTINGIVDSIYRKVNC